MTAERWQCVRTSAIVLSTMAKSATAARQLQPEGCTRTSKRREKNRIPRAPANRQHNEAKNITVYDNYCPQCRFIARRYRERRAANAFFSPILAFSTDPPVSHRPFIYQLYAARFFLFFFFYCSWKLEATRYSYFRTFAHGRATYGEFQQVRFALSRRLDSCFESLVTCYKNGCRRKSEEKHEIFDGLLEWL